MSDEDDSEPGFEWDADYPEPDIPPGDTVRSLKYDTRTEEDDE